MYKLFAKPLLFTMALCCMLKAFSQEQEKVSTDYFKAATIPDSLKQGSNSVVRYFYRRINVKNPGKATFINHSVVTVLNEKASGESVMLLSYNKFNSVDNAEMNVYNADGILIKKYKKSDMYDGSATDDATVVSDDRFKGVKHTIASYPVTIEITTQESANSFIDLGNWYIQDEEQGVQYAKVQILQNPSVGFHYATRNTRLTPVKSSENGQDVYTWEVKDLKPFTLEEGAMPWAIMPRVSFATNLFEYSGKPGDMSSWKTFGQWIQDLNKDANSLSPQRCLEIQQMTDSIKTDKEKAKFLYQYMQKNMRYVSIQLGIGGLKPFPASFVDQKKYGDCKALSNYMQALLKAVNIPSYYTVINAGENKEPAIPSFVNDPFNHIILCVPFKNDTTWLECTSNLAPFGKPGTFTENRYGMLITDDGGKLVKTPVSKMEDNRFDAEANVFLEEDGGARAHLKLSATGGYRDDYNSLMDMKTDDQKGVMIRTLNLKQPSIFDLKHAEDLNGTKHLEIDLEYDKYADIVSGNKQFYRPVLFNLCNFTLPALEKRKSDYYFSHPMQKSSITLVNLPAGYEVETLPANVDIRFSYGTFNINYALDAQKNQVKAVCKFNLSKHVIPAAQYNEMQLYVDDIAKAQSKKLIIRKKS